MKRKEVIQGIINTMQKELPFPVLERDLKLPVNSGQMITLVGVRRCGKSSLMKIVANQLLEMGVARERILWINFDDERLAGMLVSELDDVLQAYREMYPEIPLASVYIFFDEIQNVDGWELFVMRVYKSSCQNIYLSGSNAKMLSSQIATALRGWPIEFEIFPLSFEEYLRFKGISASKYDEQGRALLLNYSKEYIHSSTFPEIVLMKEESLKIRKVQGYFNTMLFRDLIEHYGLSNPETIRYFIKRLMGNLSKPTSIINIYNDIKSQGRRVDKNRLYEFAEMMCDVFMFFKVGRWSKSLIKENSYQPKYYFIDNGMRNAILLPQSGDEGKLLENTVFLHLRRNLAPSFKISYYLEKYECDFVVQQEDHIIKLVQVSWSVSDPETKTREIRGIEIASQTTGCTNCQIITFEEEETIATESATIEVIPVWKWLLTNPIFEKI